MTYLYSNNHRGRNNLIHDKAIGLRQHGRMAKSRTKSLTVEQNENLRQIARELLASKPFGGNESAIGVVGGGGGTGGGGGGFRGGTGGGVVGGGVVGGASGVVGGGGNVGAGMVIITALSRYTRTPVDELLQGKRKTSIAEDKFPARSDALRRNDARGIWSAAPM